MKIAGNIRACWRAHCGSEHWIPLRKLVCVARRGIW